MNSPQLLQLSGIGPGKLLTGFGIPVVLDNSSVGGNLQDHLAVSYSFKATQPTVNDELNTPLARARCVALSRGALRSLVLECQPIRGLPARGFRATRARRAARTSIRSPMAPGDANRTRIELDAFAGFILCFQPSRPTSRGRIDITSADYRQAPAIEPNYLSTPEDQRDAVQGGLLIQRIARTKAMRSLIRASIAPHLDAMTPEDLLADFRARAATVYHPVSTCRMGASPARFGRGSQLARARHPGAACRGCLGVPDRDLRQHQCADAHGRSESSRYDFAG